MRKHEVQGSLLPAFLVRVGYKAGMKLATRAEVWGVDALRPYEANAKSHPVAQVELLVRSIREYGFNAPILVSEEHGIVAGHGRLLAARELDMTEVPVVVLDHLTEEQVQEYRLADNKLTEVGGWDAELLRQELEEIIARGVDMEALGFVPEDLHDQWKSDIEKINREKENLDGIPGRIIITCDSFLRDEIVECLDAFKRDRGYEFTVV